MQQSQIFNCLFIKNLLSYKWKVGKKEKQEDQKAAEPDIWIKGLGEGFVWEEQIGIVGLGYVLYLHKEEPLPWQAHIKIIKYLR